MAVDSTPEEEEAEIVFCMECGASITGEAGRRCRACYLDLERDFDEEEEEEGEVKP
jgi:ribosomal protein L40E